MGAAQDDGRLPKNLQAARGELAEMRAALEHTAAQYSALQRSATASCDVHTHTLSCEPRGRGARGRREGGSPGSQLLVFVHTCAGQNWLGDVSTRPVTGRHRSRELALAAPGA